MNICRPLILLSIISATLTSGNLNLAASELTVEPKTIQLTGPFDQCQMLVNVEKSDQSAAVTRDLTSSSKYTSEDPAIATVDRRGRVFATGNGTTRILISTGSQQTSVNVTVASFTNDPQVGYLQHVAPIISKAGCNMGACHATQYGKGGFKLSVFGFDPKADHQQIVRDRQQRRVNSLDPRSSLFLQKPTMQVPHGGGKRLSADSADYDLLAAWIACGTPGPDSNEATIERLSVSPQHCVSQFDEKQQLRVEAHYDDGTTRDVTAWARFNSQDDAVVAVNSDGLVTTVGEGQTTVLVRFEGHAEICTMIVPYQSVPESAFTDWKNNNFIDELAIAKFKELGIVPSALADDATFIRRSYLDVTGTLPTPEQTAAFLKSKAPDKRSQLVDELLGLTGDPERDTHNDAYAAWWTLKWSDLIRNNSNALGDQGMWALHNWIRESFRINKPFDQFVQELVTARGSIYMNGPANYFRINRTSSDLAESTSQLFLGVRLTCAKCHHHPFEKYGQEDYYGFAAFFSRVGTKNSQEFGLFGRESVVMVRSTGDVRHPKTGKNMTPAPLEGEPVDHELDRRIPLAEWLTSKDNHMFSEAIVNRYMSYLLGRGLVEPVDDMRATNPPSNVALMNALAQHVRDTDYDLKQLLRVILNSRLYQLSSQPTEHNHRDRKFYSHYRVKRLAAEALLDSVDQVTGHQTKFRSLPIGTRAIELPDAEYPNYFLTTFAKPRRASVCECERNPDENLAQALHTLNGDILATKLTDKNGQIAKLMATKPTLDDIVRQLYMTALCRPPSDQELQACKELRAEFENDQEFAEDLLWSLINSKQFLFVR